MPRLNRPDKGTSKTPIVSKIRILVKGNVKIFWIFFFLIFQKLKKIEVIFKKFQVTHLRAPTVFVPMVVISLHDRLRGQK